MAQLDLIVNAAAAEATTAALDSAFDKLIAKAYALQAALSFKATGKGTTSSMDSAEAYMKRVKKLHEDIEKISEVKILADIRPRHLVKDIKAIQQAVTARGPITIWAVVRTKKGGGGGGIGTGGGGEIVSEPIKPKSKKEYVTPAGTVFTNKAAAQAAANKESVVTKAPVVPQTKYIPSSAEMALAQYEANNWKKVQAETVRRARAEVAAAKKAQKAAGLGTKDIPQAPLPLAPTISKERRIQLNEIEHARILDKESAAKEKRWRTYVLQNKAYAGTDEEFYHGKSSKIKSTDPLGSLKAAHEKDTRAYIAAHPKGSWEPVYISRPKTSLYAARTEKEKIADTAEGYAAEMADYKKRLESVYSKSTFKGVAEVKKALTRAQLRELGQANLVSRKNAMASGYVAPEVQTIGTHEAIFGKNPVGTVNVEKQRQPGNINTALRSSLIGKSQLSPFGNERWNAEENLGITTPLANAWRKVVGKNAAVKNRLSALTKELEANWGKQTDLGKGLKDLATRVRTSGVDLYHFPDDKYKTGAIAPDSDRFRVQVLKEFLESKITKSQQASQSATKKMYRGLFQDPRREAYRMRMDKSGKAFDSALNLEELFPGQQITTRPDGSQVIKTKTGQKLTWRGASANVPSWAHGQYGITDSGKQQVQISKALGSSMMGTGRHEQYHWLEGIGLTTNKENLALAKYLKQTYGRGNKENRADWMSSELLLRKGGLRGQLGNIPPEVESLLSDIQSGKIFERTATRPGGGTSEIFDKENKWARQAKNPRYNPQAARERSRRIKQLIGSDDETYWMMKDAGLADVPWAKEKETEKWARQTKENPLLKSLTEKRRGEKGIGETLYEKNIKHDEDLTKKLIAVSEAEEKKRKEEADKLVVKKDQWETERARQRKLLEDSGAINEGDAIVKSRRGKTAEQIAKDSQIRTARKTQNAQLRLAAQEGKLLESPAYQQYADAGGVDQWFENRKKLMQSIGNVSAESQGIATAKGQKYFLNDLLKKNAIASKAEELGKSAGTAIEAGATKGLSAAKIKTTKTLEAKAINAIPKESLITEKELGAGIEPNKFELKRRAKQLLTRVPDADSYANYMAEAEKEYKEVLEQRAKLAQETPVIHTQKTTSQIKSLEQSLTDAALAARGKEQPLQVEKLKQKLNEVKNMKVTPSNLGDFKTRLQSLQHEADTLHGKILRLNNQKGGPGGPPGAETGGKTGGFAGMSGMQKWAMYMSGIAATLFVFQQAVTYMNMLVGAGQGYEDTLRKMAAAAGMTNDQMKGLDSTFASIMKAQGYGQADLAGYGQELLRLGVSYNDLGPAMEKAAKIAEATGMKPAEAAAAAIDKVYGLTDAYLDQSKMLDGTLAKATAKLGTTVTLMLTSWYRDKEPDLINWLNAITKWVSANEGPLINTINVFMEGLVKIGNVLGFIISSLTKVMDLMTKADQATGSLVSDNIGTLIAAGGAAYVGKKIINKVSVGAVAGEAAMDAVALSSGSLMAKAFGKQMLLLASGIGIAIAAAFAVYSWNKSRQDKAQKEVDDATQLKSPQERLYKLENLKTDLEKKAWDFSKDSEVGATPEGINASRQLEQVEKAILNTKDEIKEMGSDWQDDFASINKRLETTSKTSYMPMISDELSKMSADVFAKTGLTDSYTQVLGKTITDLADQFKRLGVTTGLVAEALKKEQAELLKMAKFENWNTLITPKMTGMQAYSNIFGGDIKGGVTTQTGYMSKPGVQLSTRYDEFFNKAADTYNVSADLLKAVASVESNFNPTLTSPKGAQGIMQIMPETAKSLGLKDAYDPETSILAAANLLAGLFKKYNGNLELTLAAYNAGETAVDRYKGVPPYKETQEYIPKVMGKLDSTLQQLPGISISEIVEARINNEIDKMFNTGAFTRDEQGIANAAKYKQARIFEEDQKTKAPTMTFYDQLFALSGKTSEAFWTNETAKYEQAIITMGDLATKEEKDMFRARSKWMQEEKRREPQVKALEATQAVTGQAPPALIKIMRERLAEEQEKEWNLDWVKENIKAQDDLQRKHAIEIRNIDMLEYKGRLDAAKDFFDQTGILTETYQSLELKQAEDMYKNDIASGRYNEEELKKLYEYRLENLRKSFIEPAKKDLEELQRVTGIMTPQLYSWSTADVNDQAKRMKDKGAPEELVDEWQRRQYLSINADMLESNKNFFDASQAAWLRYQAQQKTISQEISETWLSMFGSLENEWRQGFFDVFTGDMSKLGDVAKNTGKIIQRALSDISFSIIKDQMMEMGKTGLPALKGMFSGAGGLWSMLSGSSTQDFGNKEKTAGLEETGITESDLPNDAWPSETRFLDKFKEMTGLGAEKARETALMNVSAQVVNINGAGAGAGVGGAIPSIFGKAGEWFNSGIGTNTVNDKGEAYSSWGAKTGDWPKDVDPYADPGGEAFEEPVPVELEADNFLDGLGKKFEDFFANFGSGGKSNEFDGGGTGWWTTAGKAMGTIWGLVGGQVKGYLAGGGSGNLSGAGGEDGYRSKVGGWNEEKLGGAYGAMGRYAFAKGDVFNTPTYFKFAKGLGVMGEAGPEAVLPLQRDAQGKLGVAGGTSITVPVTIEGNQSITPAKQTQLRHEIETVCRDFVQREMR